MFLQIAITALTLVMILFQWIHAHGGLAIPLLALVSFLAYRQSYCAAMLVCPILDRSRQLSGGSEAGGL